MGVHRFFVRDGVGVDEKYLPSAAKFSKVPNFINPISTMGLKGEINRKGPICMTLFKRKAYYLRTYKVLYLTKERKIGKKKNNIYNIQYKYTIFY